MNGRRDQEKKSAGDSTPQSASRTIAVMSDRIDSRALFGSGRQITIEHGTEAYTLRLTAQNKLILTK